jgi:MarR family transcriptional regulator, organic hydroperoxide resistance regulator
MSYKQLKLENQLCFPLYAASHLITRRYKPYLDKMGITYPQYLVFLVLWEEDGLSVNRIAEKLILNTNTVTPLLKRMEQQGLLMRRRSHLDERKVMISLSEKGKKLREQAAGIPRKLASGLIPEVLTVEEVSDLKEKLQRIILRLLEEQKPE